MTHDAIMTEFVAKLEPGPTFCMRTQDFYSAYVTLCLTNKAAPLLSHIQLFRQMQLHFRPLHRADIKNHINYYIGIRLK